MQKMLTGLAVCTVLLLVPLTFAAGTGDTARTAEIPEWLILVLGAILPWIYQKIVWRLPGWLKYLIVWGSSALVAVACMLIFYRLSPAEILRNVALLWATMQTIYNLWVKPAVAARKNARMLAK